MPTETIAPSDLKQLAADVLARALKAGATDAEAVVYEGDEFSAGPPRPGRDPQGIRLPRRRPPRLHRLRHRPHQRTASTSSSDFSPESIDRLVSGAVTLARITSEDPFAGLPEPEAFGQHDPAAQHLYFDDVNQQPPADRIRIAREVEAASMAYDTRIQNSGGGDFDTATSHKIMMNSRGFTGEYRRSYCGFSAQPIAHDDARQHAAQLLVLERAHHPPAGRPRRHRPRSRPPHPPPSRRPARPDPASPRRLLRRDRPLHHRQHLRRRQRRRHLSPRHLLRRHARRTRRRRKRHRHRRRHPGLRSRRRHPAPDGFGTSPFDGEGLPTRRTVLVENGILKNYVTNTYTARKLGLASTGNASRSLASNPGIGAGNFFLEPGTLTPEQIIGDVKSGLYVTETMGFGVNLVTGDYSQGAAGLWIENGELAYPVEEITIAGNLKDMYRNISAIGNDLDFRSASAAPTLRIDGMTIAGS